MTRPSELGRPKFVGVVHLPALPGDPCASASTTFKSVYDSAMGDAERLVSGGVDGLIVENFGSAPFYKGSEGDRIPPHQAAAITAVCAQIKSLFPEITLGVNCLRNDAYTALGIASATGADFIRVNVHTGAYLTDQGVIEGEAAHTLSYRASLGSNQPKIWADILVKHATPLAPITPEQAASDTLYRGRADALIVTGTGTGAPVDEMILKKVRNSIGPAPLYIGSGLTLENVSVLACNATGAIVGTALKERGHLHAPVSLERVRSMREALDIL